METSAPTANLAGLSESLARAEHWVLDIADTPTYTALAMNLYSYTQLPEADLYSRGGEAPVWLTPLIGGWG